MVEIVPNEAILRAREALGLPASVAGEALRIERLDAPGSFYRVMLAPGGGGRRLALIDARTGTLMQHAELGSGDGNLMVSREQAITAAALGHRASARLVWRPSRASQSPLYPIWEVSAAGERRYVDQQGQVWDVLSPTGRGG